MTHSDEDALFLRSIPNGVLEEFRAEAVYDTTLTSNSGLDFFAMADYNSGYNCASDPYQLEH